MGPRLGGGSRKLGFLWGAWAGARVIDAVFVVE